MLVEVIRTEKGIRIPIPEEMASAANIKAGETGYVYERQGKLIISATVETDEALDELLMRMAERKKREGSS